MDDVWSALAALATVALPMVLAWWLLGRPPRGAAPRRDPRGKMPPNQEP